MFTYTLNDARNSGAFKNVSGLCSDSDEFREMINEVGRRVWKRGEWFGQEILMRFCIYNGCVVLPRHVIALMGFRSCSGEYNIRNHWWEIVGPHCCDPGFSQTIVEAGTSPCYNEITGTAGKFIRAYPTKLEDVGKTITLFGEGPGSQPLQEKVDGVWRRGITLTLASPYVQSAVLVKRITSVVREATQANVLLYEFDTASGTVRDLALYEPNEVNPRYRRYRVPHFCSIPTGCPESNGVRLKQVEAIVSLNFIPAVSAEDFLAIDDWDSVKLGIQAIRLEEANQDEAAETKWIKAIREINFTERKMLPGQQTSVRITPTAYLESPM